MKKVFFIVWILVLNQLHAQITTSEVKVEQTNNITSIQGPVGIGTTSPDNSLTFPYNSSGIGFEYSNTNSNVYHSISKNINGAGPLVFKTNYATWPSTASIFEFQGGGGNIALEILNNGNVGIGTPSPDNSLTFTYNSSGIGFEYSNTNSNVYHSISKNISGAGPLVFKTNYATWPSTASIFEFQGGGGNVALEILNNGNVGIGTTNPNYKLEVSGTVRANTFSAISPPSWPDFVFMKSYKLRTLKEVEQHINEKGHLPEIPSEAEVTENGINLGEMDAKLLQKIEELTLYLIAQNKKIEELEKKMTELEKD